jgi:hypothetical protein
MEAGLSYLKTVLQSLRQRAAQADFRIKRIVRNFLLMGMSIAQITEITGPAIAQVALLHKSHCRAVSHLRE